MPSKPHEMNRRDNSMRRDQNKNSDTEVYIGNIALVATKANLHDFFEDVNVTSLRLFNKANRAFAFATFPDVPEAEKVIEIYHGKDFMGHRLVLRFANTINQDKKPDNLPQMPKLEDIRDDDSNESSSGESDDKSYHSKRITSARPQLQDNNPERNCFEDSLDIQPDSSGLFSLCIHRKDSYLRSKNVIEKIFCAYGSVSSVSFVDDTIVVKMPSKQQVINSFKALGHELKMSIGGNSVDNNTMKRPQNKSQDADSDTPKIYIGNISVKASREQLLEFFGDVKITSFRLLSKNHKVFGFATFSDMAEAEKAVELYNNQLFMRCKLVIRLADGRNKRTETLMPPMPALEDIGDDNGSEEIASCKSYNSRMMPSAAPHLDIYPGQNPSNKLSKSHCKDNKKSDSRKLVNDWINSQEDLNLNEASTDSQDSLTLFVGNFPMGMSEEQLLALFQDFHVSNVNIINNHNPKRSTQALVNFPNQRESKRAIHKFDKCQYKGSTLLVTSAGFCPCHDNQKSNSINEASSGHSLPAGSPDKKASIKSRKNNRSRNKTSPEDNLQMEEENQQVKNSQFGSPPSHSLPAMDQCRGSNSSDKRLEYLGGVPKQLGRNCQQTACVSPNKQTSINSQRDNSFRNKKLHEDNLQMEEENHQVKHSQIDEPFKAEAAKMTILVKRFQIQPSSLGSSSDILQVMITSVVNNELFWGNVFSSLNSDLTDFMVLHNELQTSALSWPKYILSKKEMKCVALYQGEWYRACVLNSVEKDVVEVFFVDYGNISQIQLNDVRSTDETVWKLPPKARAFKIDSNSEKLPQNAENQFFYVKVCKSGNMANGFISVATLVSH